MLLKSLKYILAIIFFFLSIVLAFSADLIPKKKPSLQSDEISDKKFNNLIIPQEKPNNKKKVIKKEEKIIEKWAWPALIAFVPKYRDSIVIVEL